MIYSTNFSATLCSRLYYHYIYTVCNLNKIKDNITIKIIVVALIDYTYVLVRIKHSSNVVYRLLSFVVYKQFVYHGLATNVIRISMTEYNMYIDPFNNNDIVLTDGHLILNCGLIQFF